MKTTTKERKGQAEKAGRDQLIPKRCGSMVNQHVSQPHFSATSLRLKRVRVSWRAESGPPIFSVSRTSAKSQTHEQCPGGGCKEANKFFSALKLFLAGCYMLLRVCSSI